MIFCQNLLLACGLYISHSHVVLARLVILLNCARGATSPPPPFDAILVVLLIRNSAQNSLMVSIVLVDGACFLTANNLFSAT